MAGVGAVLHAATLHKPHVGTHGQQAFVDTNVSGTLALLEAASRPGSAPSSSPRRPAPSARRCRRRRARRRPGSPRRSRRCRATSTARPSSPPRRWPSSRTAATACRWSILRTARFFPEGDDDPATRAAYGRDNLQVNELLHRRADIADVAEAHLLAAARAPSLGFGRYIVSATTPFTPDDLPELSRDAAAVVARRYPAAPAILAARGWRLFATIDRVYVNAAARAALGWRPAHDFAHGARGAGRGPRLPQRARGACRCQGVPCGGRRPGALPPN